MSIISFLLSYHTVLSFPLFFLSFCFFLFIYNLFLDSPFILICSHKIISHLIIFFPLILCNFFPFPFIYNHFLFFSFFLYQISFNFMSNPLFLVSGHLFLTYFILSFVFYHFLFVISFLS